MLIKEADTIAYAYPFPAKISVKNSTFTLLERGCYFLWLTYSKMATIRIAKDNNTINSSYVLIKTPPSLLPFDQELYCLMKIRVMIKNVPGSVDKQTECCQFFSMKR